MQCNLLFWLPAQQEAIVSPINVDSVKLDVGLAWNGKIKFDFLTNLYGDHPLRKTVKEISPIVCRVLLSHLRSQNKLLNTQPYIQFSTPLLKESEPQGDQSTPFYGNTSFNIQGKSAQLALTILAASRILRELEAAEGSSNSSDMAVQQFAATGIVGEDGKVDSVDFVREKIIAAQKYFEGKTGVKIFIPRANWDEISESKDSNLLFSGPAEVIAVSHVQDAFAFLGIDIKVFLGGNPYKGLGAYEYDNSSCFYGREEEIEGGIAQLIEAYRLGTVAPSLIIKGDSGSGKSSFMQSGLLPALITRTPNILRSRRRSKFSIWRCDSVLVRDESHFVLGIKNSLAHEIQGLKDLEIFDFQTLAIEIKKISDQICEFVWVVDQLDALVSVDSVDELLLDGFSEFLIALRESGAWVVATLRKDLEHRFSCNDYLRQWLKADLFLRPINDERNVRNILIEPVKQAGFEWEVIENLPLSELIVSDFLSLDSNANPLPLLSLTLYELVEDTLADITEPKGSNRVLRFASYRKLGGLEGIIGRLAEEALKDLMPNSSEKLEKVLCSLASVSKESGQVFSRTMSLSVLLQNDDERKIVLALVEARLLTIGLNLEGQEILRVAHESLLTQWPRARQILNQSVEQIQLRDELHNLALLWKNEGGYLLPQGGKLDAASSLNEYWIQQLDCADLVKEFISASNARAMEESLKKKRHQRQLQIGFFVLLVAFVVAMIAVYLERSRSNELERQKIVSKFKTSMAESGAVDRDVFRETLALREGSSEWNEVVDEALSRSGSRPTIRKLMLPHQFPDLLKFSEDGSFIYTHSNFGPVWEVNLLNNQSRQLKIQNNKEIVEWYSDVLRLNQSNNLILAGPYLTIYNLREDKLIRNYSLPNPYATKLASMLTKDQILVASGRVLSGMKLGADGLEKLWEVSIDKWNEGETVSSLAPIKLKNGSGIAVSTSHRIRFISDTGHWLTYGKINETNNVSSKSIFFEHEGKPHNLSLRSGHSYERLGLRWEGGGYFYFVHTDSGRLSPPISLPRRDVFDFSFQRNRDVLMFFSQTGLFSFDLPESATLRHYSAANEPIRAPGGVISARFSNNGTIAATVNSKGEIFIWELEKYEDSYAPVKIPLSLTSEAFYAIGKPFFLAMADRHILVLDPHKKNIVGVVKNDVLDGSSDQIWLTESKEKIFILRKEQGKSSIVVFDLAALRVAAKLPLPVPQVEKDLRILVSPKGTVLWLQNKKRQWLLNFANDNASWEEIKKLDGKFPNRIEDNGHGIFQDVLSIYSRDIKTGVSYKPFMECKSAKIQSFDTRMWSACGSKLFSFRAMGQEYRLIESVSTPTEITAFAVDEQKVMVGTASGEVFFRLGEGTNLIKVYESNLIEPVTGLVVDRNSSNILLTFAGQRVVQISLPSDNRLQNFISAKFAPSKILNASAEQNSFMNDWISPKFRLDRKLFCQWYDKGLVSNGYCFSPQNGDGFKLDYDFACEFQFGKIAKFDTSSSHDNPICKFSPQKNGE